MFLVSSRVVSLRVNRKERQRKNSPTQSWRGLCVKKRKKKSRQEATTDHVSRIPNHVRGFHLAPDWSRRKQLSCDWLCWRVLRDVDMRMTDLNALPKQKEFRKPKKRKGTHEVISFMSSIVSVLSFASTSSTSLKKIKE